MFYRRMTAVFMTIVLTVSTCFQMGSFNVIAAEKSDEAVEELAAEATESGHEGEASTDGEDNDLGDISDDIAQTVAAENSSESESSPADAETLNENTGAGVEHSDSQVDTADSSELSDPEETVESGAEESEADSADDADTPETQELQEDMRPDTEGDSAETTDIKGILRLDSEGQGVILEDEGEKNADDLFADYVENSFGVENGQASPAKKSRRKSAASNLTGIDRAVYNSIAAYLPQIAAGDRASTVLEISVDDLGLDRTFWTAEELGISSVLTLDENGDVVLDDEGYASISEEAMDAVEEKTDYDLSKILNALVADYPYQLYWYEKTQETEASPYTVTGYYDETTEEYLVGIIDGFTVSFPVAEDYSAGQYEVDTSIGQTVQASVANAAAIVERYQNAADYSKLCGYKDEICERVSYNDEAAAGEVNYGNPWQLIWVFDDDPETNVVCEGYAKAFKCLCDMTQFTADIECILVTGTMDGGTGEGPHMWNIVNMEDGNNYLVDVTNCDEQTIGEPDLLFLAGSSDVISTGSFMAGFRFHIDNTDISYQYDEDTLSLYDNDYLTISTDRYVFEGNAPKSLNTLISDLPAVSETSIQHYYYNQLSDIQKALYWELVSCIEDRTFDIYIQMDGKSLGSNEISELISVVRAENPLLTAYTQDTYSTSSEDENVLSLKIFKSRYSSYQIDRAQMRINQIVQTMGDGDRFTQIVNLLAFISRNIIYDFDSISFNGGINSRHSNDIMGGLIYDACVCEGFSLLIKEVCDEKEIPCLIVEGEIKDQPNYNHMWNVIQMDDGQWYLLDASRIGKNILEIRDVTEEILTHPLKGEDFRISHWEYGGCNSIGIQVTGNGDISVPAIAASYYEYQGIYDPSSYHEADLILDDHNQFTYKVNNDLKTCSITGYEGTQKGDLIIPEYIDGYCVTDIAANAFYKNRGFTGNLVIPDTVETIGDAAFYHCDGLSGSLTLSSNLKSIGRIAFMDCTNLSGDIELPNSLTTLEENAFFRCEHITGNVTIPQNITSVHRIFQQCYGITSFTVDENNPELCSLSGVIYTKDMTELVLCPPGLTELIIPDTVTIIGESACFDNRGLKNTELNLPPYLQRIEDHAFQGADLVGDIIIPDSVTYIGYGAFSRNADESVKGRTLKLSNNLQYLGDSAFANCGFAGEVYIPQTLLEVDGINTFNGNQITLLCECNNTIFIDYWNDDGKYVDNVSLYLLHDTTEAVNSTVVEGTEGITSVEFICGNCNKQIYDLETENEIQYRGGVDGSNVTWKIDSEGRLLFCGTGHMGSKTYAIPPEGKESVREIIIQEGIENIGESMCIDLTALKTVHFPNSVTSIDFNAFSNCSALEEIRIPSSIKSIGMAAFNDCSGLERVILEDGVESLGDYCFQRCNLNTIYMPFSVNNIGSSIFAFSTNRVIIQGLSDCPAANYASRYGYQFAPVDEHLDHMGDYGIPLVSISSREPTCSQEGFQEGTVCGICGGLLTATIIRPKTDHLWGDPEWIWYQTDRGFAAKAKFVCEYDASHIEVVDAEITSEAGSGENTDYIQYTATVDHGYMSYLEEKTIIDTEALVQPENAYVDALGEQAIISVESSARDLMYQWYYKNAGSSRFLASSQKTATYSVKVAEKVRNRLVYCEITDAYGNRITTDTVGIYINTPLEITEQPRDVYVDMLGDKATVSVTASGTALQYRWYYKNKGSSKFLPSTNTTSAYSVTVNERVKGRKVYCEITDAKGESVTTDTVGIYVNEPLEIVQQPQDAFVNAIGEKATISVIATGMSLTYQWYYKNKGSARFLASTNKTPTYSVTVNDRVKNRQVYCKITDISGQVLTTDTVTIRVYEPLEIIVQPENVSVGALNEKATVSVVAKGMGLTYQWYYKNTNSSRFLPSSNTTAYYTVTVNTRVVDRKVYCVITDMNGESVTTDTVTITVAE